MKHTILKYLSFAIILTTLFSSCRKDKFVNEDNELGDNGYTFVKVLEGTEASIFLESAQGTALRTIFTVRKDAGTEAVNNASATITLTSAPDLITAYNAAHPTAPNVPNTYEALPESVFTPGPGITKTATGYTMALAPGEFSKEFSINMNFPAFDFSKKYVLAFKITATGIDGKVSVQKSVVAVVGVKNAWDGVYTTVAGTVTRYTAPGVPAGDALSGNMAGNPDVRLVTTSATTVTITGLNWAASGGGVGGVDPITMTIDPVTNKVTSIKSTVATSMNIVAGAINQYDPTTKTFTVNFDWNQTANKREILGLVLKYKGSR